MKDRRDDSTVPTLGGQWSQEQQKEIAEQIETLRRRAKDNKEHNVEFFLSQSFTSLEHIRNLLITLSVAGIGFLHTNVVVTNNANVGGSLFWSLVIGCISYVFQYLSLAKEADYYSEKERIFSEAYPSIERYKEMMANESKIKKDIPNNLRGLSLLALLAQMGFVIYATYLLTSINLTLAN